MEYLLVASFVILLTIPLIIIFTQQSTSFNNEVSLSQTNKALNRIIDSANTVYYLGTPSKRTISVYFPEGINSLTVENDSILAIVRRDFVFSVISDSQLNGTLSNIEGLHTVTIEAKDNFVQIEG